MLPSAVARATGNQFLDRLPETEYLAALTLLRPTRFEAGERTAEGEVLFPFSGLWVVTVKCGDGSPTETDSVGRDGVIGMAAALCDGRPEVSAVSRVAGEGLRTDAAELRELAATYPKLATAAQCYLARCWAVAEVLVACERLHPVDARLAHLLLRTADRLPDPDGFPLTQATLADMMGASRQTVTTIAARLQRESVIAYRRGVLRVTDRDRLEAAACPCREVMRRLEVEK